MFKARPPHPHIELRLILIMGLRDLWAKRFRSALTIMGVSIGIGSIFFLLSFGLGLQNLVQQQIIGNKAISTIDVTSPNDQVLPINQEGLTRIKNLSNVTGVSGIYSYAGTIKLQDATADTVIYGVDPLYMSLSNVSLKAGSILKDTDNNKLIIDYSLLQAVGIDKAEDGIGKQVSLDIDLDGKSRTENFKISGVSDSGSGSEVFIPHSVFQSAGISHYTQLKVQINSRNNIATLRKQIESFGYQTSSPVDTLEQINQVFKFFNVILVGFGSIGLIIAVLGMLNTLTVSLLERTQEIALMIALGARTRDMRRLFIAEGIMLSLIGGLVGMVLATVLGLMINAVLNQLAAARGVTDSFSIFATPIALIAGVVVFTCSVGYIVALVPARRAARINTIDALRHE